MPPGNITRGEAARRSSAVTVLGYDVELDLSTAPAELGRATFKSCSKIEFQASAQSGTWLDLIADCVESVRLNGSARSVAQVAGRLQLTGLDTHNVVEVVAHCCYSTTGEGLHRFRDPADSQTYLYTQFATAEARRVFACFEQPDMKAPLRLTVLAPESWEVVANSPLASRTSGGGVSRWQFEPTPALPTYVMAAIAGPYHRVHGEHRGGQRRIPLGLLIRASMAEHLDAAELFELTSAGLAHFERVFGMDYPFAKYDQIFVPEFNLGAMENPGAVTLREDSFIFRSRVPSSAREMRANVILHEMAHMWFGDLVTMRWWDDLWLNESFAEWCGHYAAAVATPFVDSWVTFALAGKARAARADQLPSTHPIACEMVDLDAVYLNFDGITYAKGASVLRQLVAWVGLEPFLRGVGEYFAAHAWGNTTLHDLLTALSRASGRDLTSWASLWLQSVGVNTLRLQVSTHGQRYRSVILAQEPAVAPEGVAAVLRPHRVAIGVYRWEGSGDRRLVRCDRHEVDLVGASVEISQLAGADVAHFLLPNDGDLTFAKIRLDPVSQAAAFASVSCVNEPLARALIWGSAWDMVRDGELPVQAYLEMIAKELRRERNTSLLAAVYATLAEVIGTYLPSDQVRPSQVKLAAALLGHARAGEPGSEVQLLHVRAYLRHARDEDQLKVVRLMLRPGDQVPIVGLVVDQELRWQAVTRLVALGAAPVELISAELARDPTMTGQRAAAFASAAQPSQEAKELAWRRALASVSVAWPATANIRSDHGDQRSDVRGVKGKSDGSPGGHVPVAADDPIPDPLSNALLQATVAGFRYPEHAELIASYAPKYFQVVEHAWRSGSANHAAEVARGLFPLGNVSVSNLAQARRFLAKEGLDPGLARIVSECADGLARALRVQAASSHRST